MVCPRCGHTWNVIESPCEQCGFLARLPRPLNNATRLSSPSQQQRSLLSETSQEAGRVSAAHKQPPQGTQQALSSLREQITSQSMELFHKGQSGMTAAIRQITGHVPALRKGQSESSLRRQEPLPALPPPGTSGLPSATSLTAKQGFLAERQNLSSASPASSSMTPPVSGDHVAQGTPLHIMTVPQQNVPVRPYVITPEQKQASNQLVVYRPVKPILRAHRLVSSALPQEEVEAFVTQARMRSVRPVKQSPGEPLEEPVSPLLPGTLLRGGRYQLRSRLGRQQWQAGVYETVWSAHDAQRHGELVMVYEVGVSPVALSETGQMSGSRHDPSVRDDLEARVHPSGTPSGDPLGRPSVPTIAPNSVAMQTMLRTATVTLTSIGRHARIPALWDVFSEQGRHFFVFEAVGDESLLERMQRTRHTLAEFDAVECCLQMLEVLSFLGQQSSPLIHGCIRPEHIMIGRERGQYFLTGFSLVLAGGATELVAGIGHDSLTPYMAPEFGREAPDGSADLYALLASAYYALTGYLPLSMDGSGYIPHSQRFNSRISAQCDAILERGLLPIASERYRDLREVAQEFQALRASNGFVQPAALSNAQRFDPPLYGQMFPPVTGQATHSEGLAVEVQAVQPIVNDDQEREIVLPRLRAEDVPLQDEQSDRRRRNIYWATGFVVFVLVVVLLIRLLI